MCNGMFCQFVYRLNSQITMWWWEKAFRIFPIVTVKQWHHNNSSLMISLKKKKKIILLIIHSCILLKLFIVYLYPPQQLSCDVLLLADSNQHLLTLTWITPISTKEIKDENGNLFHFKIHFSKQCKIKTWIIVFYELNKQ